MSDFRRLIILAIVALWSMKVAAQGELPLIEADAYRGVIIPIELIQKQGSLTKRFDGFWLPTTNEIAEAEKEIAKYLASAQNDQSLRTYARKRATDIYKKLKEYRRQYVGVVIDNEKRIFCNVLTPRPTMFSDWRRRYVHLTEGGPDCWKIQYVPATHHCSNFDPDYGY